MKKHPTCETNQISPRKTEFSTRNKKSEKSARENESVRKKTQKVGVKFFFSIFLPVKKNF